jgi:hypothetical protein
MLRASVKFCGDDCRRAHDREERNRWKRENRERHLANRRRQEKHGKTKEAKRRRAERLRARRRAATPPRVCRDCPTHVGANRIRCDRCRRIRANAESKRVYHDNLQRERAQSREYSFKKYRADPLAGATVKARRKWRRVYGSVVDRPEILALLEQRLDAHRALGMYQARGGGRQRFF